MDNLLYFLYAATRLTDLKSQLSFMLVVGMVLFLLTFAVKSITRLFFSLRSAEEVAVFKQAFLGSREDRNSFQGLKKHKSPYFFSRFLPPEPTPGPVPSYAEKLQAINAVRKDEGLDPIRPSMRAYFTYHFQSQIQILGNIGIILMVLGAPSLILPTTRDAALIASSYGLTKMVQNPNVQKTFEKSVTVVEVWLDKLNVEPTAKSPAAPASEAASTAASASAVPAAQPASAASQPTAKSVNLGKAVQVIDTATLLKNQVSDLLK